VNNVAIHCLPAGADDARRLAACLAVPLHEIATHTFPDGELRVTAWPVSAVSIVYAPLDRPNDKLLALLFAAESLRRNGCKRLVLVAPYLCYMRQDAAFHPGEAISQKVIGRLIAGSFDRLITVDAHLHRTARLSDVCPGIDADNLSAMPAIARHLQANSFDPRLVIVGPDAESRGWVTELSTLLGVSCTVAKKTRLGDRSVEMILDDPKILQGRPALLVDDIVSSGGTMRTCARAVISAGATSVDAIVTHALFPPELIAEFTKSGIRSVRSTTSVPHVTASIALDQLLSDALQSELAAAPTAGAPS
jgi:ribose-phosphate pyrophosphokinase